MKIKKAIYHSIIAECSNNPIESGGIIGGKNNIVTEFIFDKGTDSSSIQHYFPDTEKLNAHIKHWQDNGIQFLGIVHSHLQDGVELSFGDTRYIETIMQAMPAYIDFLYFPVVSQQKELVSFKAVRNEYGVNIIDDDIEIIDERRTES